MSPSRGKRKGARRNRTVERRKPVVLGWGVLFRVAFGCSLATVVYLSSLHLADLQLSLDVPLAFEAEWQKRFQTRVDTVTAAIGKLPLPLAEAKEEPRGTGRLRWVHRHYEITIAGNAPAPDIPATLAPLQDPAQGVTVFLAEGPTGAEAHVSIEGLPTHTLLFRQQQVRPRLAIVIDDLGNSLLDARRVMQLDPPVTLAILPFRPFSRQVAELARMFRREALLHLPMESRAGVDRANPGLLRMDADRVEIEALVDEALGSVPHVAGVNNHMGSRFSADHERMRWVLERLKRWGLFFIDSQTTTDSVACRVAGEIAVPCATCMVFLDDVDDAEAIGTQLQSAVAVARAEGMAIAIGHARATTIDTLGRLLPALRSADIDIVPTAALVR